MAWLVYILPANAFPLGRVIVKVLSQPAMRNMNMARALDDGGCSPLTLTKRNGGLKNKRLRVM